MKAIILLTTEGNTEQVKGSKDETGGGGGAGGRGSQRVHACFSQRQRGPGAGTSGDTQVSAPWLHWGAPPSWGWGGEGGSLASGLISPPGGHLSCLICPGQVAAESFSLQPPGPNPRIFLVFLRAAFEHRKGLLEILWFLNSVFKPQFFVELSNVIYKSYSMNRSSQF